MYEYTRHRRPDRHRAFPRGSVYAAVVLAATLLLACGAEGLADLIFTLF